MDEFLRAMSWFAEELIEAAILLILPGNLEETISKIAPTAWADNLPTTNVAPEATTLYILNSVKSVPGLDYTLIVDFRFSSAPKQS